LRFLNLPLGTTELSGTIPAGWRPTAQTFLPIAPEGQLFLMYVTTAGKFVVSTSQGGYNGYVRGYWICV
jgi:hypothetical protein